MATIEVASLEVQLMEFNDKVSFNGRIDKPLHCGSQYREARTEAELLTYFDEYEGIANLTFLDSLDIKVIVNLDLSKVRNIFYADHNCNLVEEELTYLRIKWAHIDFISESYEELS